MAKVTFQFENGTPVEAAAVSGENLLELARNYNIAIDAPCSGNGSCGKCRVKLLSGELDSQKTLHISQEEYDGGWRLACISKVVGDVTVMVPDIASAYKNRMKVADLSSGEEVAIFDRTVEDLKQAGIDFTNDFSLLTVPMDPPTLDDTMPDNERLIWALKRETGEEEIVLTFQVLQNLAQVLRDSDFRVKCVLTREGSTLKVMNVLPADQDVKVTGLAIDIGTTTVSGILVDLLTGEILAKASAGNGQIRYGADVINRIIESARPGGRKRLQKAIIEETLNPMIGEMCKSSKIPVSWIYRLCIASNTTMNHLLLGVYSDPVRMEPYIPSFFYSHAVKASDLGLFAAADAKIIIAPNIGSYVGGDITAGTLSSCIWNKEEFSLFIDLGTNGELVFGNSDFLMSCACSAGPAFEGGDISCGMRATDGAIEACTIDKETMEPTFRIVGDEGQKPVGLCGSGIIDVISELFRCGIINAKGIFVREGERIRHNVHGMGSYVLAYQKDAASVKDIEITEVDIDNFIRAKGAIFSAINIMVSSLDFDVSMIDHIYVAGGIGSGINMKNAVMIGMFPDVELEKFHYIGNSSLSGAYTILLSNQAEEKVHEIGTGMTYMELSTNPQYMDEFVAACFLPHTNAGLFPTVQAELEG
ncbi:MAG: corrinoid activation/regeneration protein AcsV [Clostridiales bacterium]|nr:corrinoid activation/regeneration protein AcsV [Clostridiales bacterium]